MPYQKWHRKLTKKAGPVSQTRMYFQVLVLGLIFFALAYWYTDSQGTPNPLNKSVADTSIVLIGLSMMLSGLCYFWDFVDTKIIYRKHLGLIGFAFALVHIWLSFSPFKMLFDLSVWTQTSYLQFTTAGAATVIFTIMALVSNQYAASELGGKIWRRILRFGYVGVALIWLHVYLLKSKYWIRWFNGGMTSLPSMSMLVTIFMTLVIVMRVALWISLARKKRS